MKLKLVGASLAELESALKYSGLFVDVSDDGGYAEIRAIPAFLAGSFGACGESNIVRCGCDAAKKLAEIKDKVRAKTAELKTQVEEMGYLGKKEGNRDE